RDGPRGRGRGAARRRLRSPGGMRALPARPRGLINPQCPLFRAQPADRAPARFEILEAELSRRVLAVALLGLVLVAAGAYLGGQALRRVAPDVLREQLDARLTDALGTAVELGPVGFHVDTDGIELAAVDLRAYPSTLGPALTAARVEIQID